MSDAIEEPAAKKARTEEPEAELDAPAVTGAKVSNATFYVDDTTINIMPSSFDTLMPLTDGGLQYLLAGAKANVGLKSGRHMFEVKILEVMAPLEDANARARVPQPRSQLRLGFSTAKAELLVGETQEGLCFDSEGQFIHNKVKSQVSQKFGTGDTVAIVLNQDSSSPNGNTVSLFKDGVRVGPPQPLPEQLQGQTLFPALTFKNVAVNYNFGPEPWAPLPFKCHMINGSAKKEAEVKPAPVAPADGMYEALFPICLPDEGGFDWLDDFLAQNPSYTELSDRALLHWCEKSGLTRPKGYSPLARASNDKPEMGMGIAVIDDLSVRRVLNGVAPIQKRNFVIMEVRGNLLKEERRELTARWQGFRRVATVFVGEPPESFKKMSQQLTLKMKQEAADQEFRAKQAAEKAKFQIEKRHRQLEKEKKKAAKKQAKMQEQMVKKIQFEKQKKEAELKGEPAPEEEPEPPEEEEEEDEEPEPEEPMDMEPPKAELTKEEKKKWYCKSPVSDLTLYLLNTSLQKFCFPELEDGFAEIKYIWTPQDKANAYLKSWIQEKKLVSRVEDITPGDWFTTKFKEWQRTLQSWHSKNNGVKAIEAKKVAAKAAKEHKRKAREALREKAEKEGSELPPVEEEEEEEEESKQEATPKADFDHLDVFGVEDINDIGGGEPLYSAFQHEDWQMLSLRFELHLLSHSFRKDANDPDRSHVPFEHVAFYYNKYYRKPLNFKTFGVETFEELLELIRDSVVGVTIKGLKVIESQLQEELESLNIFAMLTEEHRRERNRRVDMGDESARLKMITPQSILEAAARATASSAAVASTTAAAPAMATNTWSPGTMTAPNMLMQMQMAQRQPQAMMPQQPPPAVWAGGGSWGQPQFPQQGMMMGGMRPGGFPGARPFGGGGWGKGW
eukprot:CAMPEP_0197629616 /NCGR_PEP_ID=MMETSP1338-20131121/7393_1 /TAXON_ID=43686 ORGANISM="Pelagodinium beii, Strain RCC1491" /NCGR_SAMPLE_ID=MMETSP1338 /ASSEMBLY_ACC=CAM_ASM_000754 /LENGTH=900 /DNA_ID=CAMNT_0043200683 /DNA_START=25 /DNA_END=2727 /DNA_ORIENTATION=+